jgi:hypothetical protein
MRRDRVDDVEIVEAASHVVRQQVEVAASELAVFLSLRPLYSDQVKSAKACTMPPWTR